MEIKLSEFLLLLKKKLWLLGAVIFICGAMALMVSAFFISPRYESKATILVQPRQTWDSTNLNFTTNIVKMATHKALTTEFLTTVRTKLSSDGKGEFSEAYLRNSIKTERKDQDYIFSITINTKSPDASYEIAKAMESLIVEYGLIPQSAGYMFQIHTSPEPSATPVSPNVALNTVLGVFIGAVLGVMLVLMLDRLDITIKSEENITEKYQGAVIGVIYEHKDNAVRGSGYGKE